MKLNWARQEVEKPAKRLFQPTRYRVGLRPLKAITIIIPHMQFKI